MDDRDLQAVRTGDVATYVAIVEDRAAAVAGRFPRPDGNEWNPEDIEDLASDFYASPAYEHAILMAHDDDSLRALVYTALANLVRSELRRTDRGRLHRRLRELMTSESFIEHPSKFWRRDGDPAEPSISTMPDLLAAAWAVEVTVARWRPDARRNRPFAERSSLVDLLDAVYDLARGAVHVDTLVEVFAHRLGVGSTSVIESLDLVEERFAVVSTSGPGEELLEQESELDAAVAALELWGQLSPRERLLVPHLGFSARQVADAVGGAKSSVHDAMTRLKEKFRTILREAEDEDQTKILSELLALAQDLPDSWT